MLRVWDSLVEVAPFGFRVLDEINAYVIAAAEIGTDPAHAIDEQLVQKVLPRLRGDADAGPAIDTFIALTDTTYPACERQGAGDARGAERAWFRFLLLSRTAWSAAS